MDKGIFNKREDCIFLKIYVNSIKWSNDAVKLYNLIFPTDWSLIVVITIHLGFFLVGTL